MCVICVNAAMTNSLDDATVASLQLIELTMKLSVLLGLLFDPKRMASVFPRCIDSLLSASQVQILPSSELRAFSTWCLLLSETSSAESSANKNRSQSQADVMSFT